MNRSSFSLDARAFIAWSAAVLAFAVTAFIPAVLNDGDTFLHVAAGMRMIDARAVLFADPFSYTFGGKPWTAHEWFAEILMAGAYRVGGWGGLIALFAMCAAVTGGVLAWTIRRWLSPVAQAIVTVLACSCMTGSLLARPHLLALPLLAVWTAEMVSARADKRAPSWWLLLVMCVWANIHGSFVLGLAVGAALGLEALIEDRRAFGRWATFGIGAVAVTLINPRFVEGAVFPLLFSGAPSLAHVDEWQPTALSLFQPLVLVTLAGAYMLITRRVWVPLVRALVVLGLVYEAFAHQRHQIVFAVIAPLLLAEPMGHAFGASDEARGAWARFAAVGAAVVLMALMVARLVLPIARGDQAVAPVTALAHVPENVRREPVLNDYSFGGYLIFAGVKPFIDSRAELYGETALSNYAALIKPDAAALERTLAEHAIAWSILSPTSPMVPELTRKGWRTAYADRFAVVQIRDTHRR
ncbi:MAG: hypothetical protein JO348_02070 [Alphaproteobacteria bacterium]|nr:hypothetical protein [Alphaproteobacteria bacterium]